MEKSKYQPDLLGKVLDQIPEGFIRQISNVLPRVYNEAYVRSFHDPAWGEPEGLYILPHNRRVLFEYQFRQLALDSGLEASPWLHAGRNCVYTAVKSGQFLLTASAVESENDLTRPAVSRRQHASINRLLQNPTFAFIDTSNFYTVDTIYTIVTHGPDKGEPKEPGFLSLGIPSSDGRSWVKRYPFVELLQGYTSRKDTAEKVRDLAMPTLKRKRKGGV